MNDAGPATCQEVDRESRGKAKLPALADEGLQESERLLDKFFGKQPAGQDTAKQG